MHVARVPDFPPPIDRLVYHREEGVDLADLDRSTPIPTPRRRGREWMFGLTGLVLGAVGTVIVAPHAKHEAATRETTRITTPSTTVSDLQTIVDWDAPREQPDVAADSSYRNPLPLLLLGRP
jgi:hypothetical protein